MAILQISLLGEPRISAADDCAIRLPTKKAQALLIYLASPLGVAHSRDQLAGLLWSRNAEEQARTNLRQNLARLRKSLGDAKSVITADAHRIALSAEQVETDIVTFEGLLARGDVAALEAATELLRGEFAAGLHINEPPVRRMDRHRAAPGFRTCHRGAGAASRPLRGPERPRQGRVPRR